jgi:hypothetical protein
VEGGARGSGDGRSGGGFTAEVGDESGGDDAEVEVFVEKGLLIGDAGFDVVDAVGVGDVGAQAGVGERALLGDCLLLEIGGAEIGEGVFAGVVVEAVAAEEVVDVEDGGGVDDVGEAGGDVDGLDLGSLVGGADGKAVGADGDAGGVGGPLGGVFGVEGVGGLEPGAGVAEIKADGVGGGDLVVNAVEEVLLVALVVDSLVLGRSRKRPVFMTLAEMKFPSFREPYARLKPTLEEPKEP